MVAAIRGSWRPTRHRVVSDLEMVVLSTVIRLVCSQSQSGLKQPFVTLVEYKGDWLHLYSILCKLDSWRKSSCVTPSFSTQIIKTKFQLSPCLLLSLRYWRWGPLKSRDFLVSKTGHCDRTPFLPFCSPQ